MPRPVAPASKVVPTSEHYEVRPLAPGVWAALHRPGGWAICNAAIVDLGGRTLVADPGMTPESGEDLGRLAGELTGRPPDFVALTHYHNDHVRGAQGLPSVAVFASEETRRLLETRGVEELISDRNHAEAGLARARAAAASAVPEIRAHGVLAITYWEALAATAARCGVPKPDVTFEQEMWFHGSDRSTHLLSLGTAHTPDDAVLVVPDSGVVFCADLLFVRFHPYFADGDPD
ncbi:MAG TPA: MBL fold metallo-hydrolase, partial [Trueperaceae bacterium]|nr:MBL fold metallo-hydrolase [Trueperaceae bacterium]